MEVRVQVTDAALPVCPCPLARPLVVWGQNVGIEVLTERPSPSVDHICTNTNTQIVKSYFFFLGFQEIIY